MALRFGVAILFVCVASSAVADDPTPILIESVFAPDLAYEQAPSFASSELLPPEVVCGPYHEISEPVVNDGFMNHYVIDSDFGRYETVGDEMTRTRVREINVTGVLQELSRRDAIRSGFGKSIKDLVLSPVRQVRHVVKNPLHLVVVIPSAVVKPIGYIVEGRELLRYGVSARAVKEYIGFSSVKRSLARRMGVNSDSDNLALQTELNKAAWAHFGGEIPIRLAENFVPGLPMPYLDLVGGGENLEDALDAATDMLEHKSKRTMMWRMGLDHSDLAAMLRHETFTDSEKKKLVSALYAMDAAEGREAVILLANEMDLRAPANALVHQLRMMADYDRDVERIERIFVRDGFVFYYTESEIVLMPIFGEFLSWTPQVAHIATALPGAYPADLPVRRREVWLAGGATPRFKDECTNLDFAVHPHAKTVLASIDAKDRVDFARRTDSATPVLVPHGWAAAPEPTVLASN